MSDSNDSSQIPQSTTFGTIGFLANNPLVADDPNPSQKNNDSDNEDTQRQRNDLQSESITPDDQNLRHRKSITSGRLIDNEETNSTPAIVDSSSNDPPQGPRRSMSESALIDTNENPPTLPIQQDESSTEDDDSEQPVSATKQNGFVETTQPENRSRIQSASSKRSPSGLANEKHAQSSDDTDREVANISRRSSRTKSPLNRPQAPEPKRVQSSSSNNQKFEPPAAIISPASRRESANKIDQQQSSRPSTTKKSKFDDDSSESLTDQSNNDFFTMNGQSKLIKPGEQLQIPTNNIDTKLLNSPPPSPATNKQMDLINPSPENNLTKTEQKNSRPGSQINNEKHVDDEIIPKKSRPSSNSSQQHPTITAQKPNSTASSRKGSTASESDQKNKIDSRRSSTDADLVKQERILSNDQRKSPLEKRSAQQSRKNSSKTIDQTVVTPMKINSSKSRQDEKRSSTTDSDNEKFNNSKLPPVHLPSPSTTPTNDDQTNAWIKQAPIPPLQTTEDETPLSRPQSPNVEQIAERNQHSSSNKKQNLNEQKKKDQNRSLRRSNSVESFNHIPLVDDQSLDSTSGNNTESDQPKQRRVKSKKKDVETNTDSRNGNHQQQQQEPTSQKSSKASKSMSDHSPSIRRRITSKQKVITTPDTEPDSNTSTARRFVKKSKIPNEDKEPVDVNATLFDHRDKERRTQSDTEHILGEKRKKRRRPKRISRTTQTYECVFRRMERGEHEELRPTNDTDKNVQTRRSCLRPSAKSPKRHYPLYVSSDTFKIEEILPKQFPSSPRNTSKAAVIARGNSPQGGKLLILRPTLPFHHTDAVNVQRISLQYAIELIPNDTTSGQRNKAQALKQSEQTNNLPRIRSSSSSIVNHPPAKTNTKDKSPANKIEDRTHQRKTGGAV